MVKLAIGRWAGLMICLANSLMLHNQIDDLLCPTCQLLFLRIVLVARGVYITSIMTRILV